MCTANSKKIYTLCIVFDILLLTHRKNIKINEQLKLVNVFKA